MHAWYIEMPLNTVTYIGLFVIPAAIFISQYCRTVFTNEALNMTLQYLAISKGMFTLAIFIANFLASIIR